MAKQAFAVLAVAVSVAAAASIANAQQMGKGSDAAYIAKVSGGAPATVVKSASIVQVQKDGSMRTLQTGTNGFTCMVMPGDTPACADKNAMGWMHALMTHSAPPDTTGFMYMLKGDAGTSNTDPYASAKTATNHWVQTGPHVMIVGAAAKTMGYPATDDPDVTKPYVMWPGTPYAHLMIPVTP